MIVQIGNTGFNSDAFKNTSREEFMSKYGNVPGANQAWEEIQKANGGSSNAPSEPSTSESESKKGGRKRKNGN